VVIQGIETHLHPANDETERLAGQGQILQAFSLLADEHVSLADEHARVAMATTALKRGCIGSKRCNATCSALHVGSPHQG